jgi:hypothetical protein
MRYLLLAFIVSILAAAAIGTGGWPLHFGHDGPAMRTIHYDTSADVSAQRRQPRQ